MTDWERCAAFHGHQCPGLTIGFKAAQYAKKLLKAEFSDNEQLVCIAENDACGVDAIQVLLGCSIGKGNLLFHMTGKQAYSFYHRGSGRSVRLLLTNRPEGLSREEAFAFYQRTSPEELFTAMPVRLALPERARLFDSYQCALCGETAGANWVRIQDGKTLCLDCCSKYDRFAV